MADAESDVFPPPTPSSSSSSSHSSAASQKNGKDCSSYTYWVRKKTGDAAPDPVPRKLSSHDLAVAAASAAVPLGSAWNQAGTWEERSITKWATERLESLLLSLEPLEFNEGRAQVIEISKCMGEASLVTVRNKKRYGYNYEITMKFKGEWRQAKALEGTLLVPEASFNELDDLQLEVNLSSSSEIISESEKNDYKQALKLFLPAIREKLQKFEDELKSS